MGLMRLPPPPSPSRPSPPTLLLPPWFLRVRTSVMVPDAVGSWARDAEEPWDATAGIHGEGKPCWIGVVYTKRCYVSPFQVLFRGSGAIPSCALSQYFLQGLQPYGVCEADFLLSMAGRCLCCGEFLRWSPSMLE